MEKTNDHLIERNASDQHFDDDLLADFADTFYGYGDYNGPYWFVGMEEGGDSSFENVEARLSTWHQQGRQELADVVDFHRAIGLEQYFDKTPPLEPAWGKLIRIILSVEGQVSSTEGPHQQRDKVRAYQRESFGRVSGGKNCLIELLPLPRPSRSLKDWKYTKYSDLPQLADPKTYEKHYLSKRAAHIQELINQHKPPIVVFYSIDRESLRWWMHIADTPFSYNPTYKAFIAQRDETLFIVTSRAAAKRPENEYFHNIGQLIAQKLEK